MTFFTKQEFENKYAINIANEDVWKIEMASDMIYSQVGLRYRDKTWDDTSCPKAVKNASMEQLRFIFEYDIPLLDVRGEIKAGVMSSDLKTDYSTLALRMLSNAGLLYRGNTLNQNMGLNIPFEG